MDKNRYDKELPCNHEPFGYLEKKTELPNKRAVISFGALDKGSYYAPEFGGVAVVYTDPEVFIAVKYIPWDARGRDEEHESLVKTIRENTMTNQELVHFLDKDGYILPAMKRRWNREYQEEEHAKMIKAQSKAQSDKKEAPVNDDAQNKVQEEEKSAPEPVAKKTHYKDEEIIPLD
jgi:hypothetical protein